MSAQGATLGRGTVHIPIWPAAVVVLLAAAAAALIGLSSVDTIAPARPVIVTDAQRLANSTAAIREQGAVAPVAIGISHVTPRAVAPAGYVGLENPGVYLPQSVGAVGLENPGAYLPRSAYPNGLENPTAYAPSEGAPAVAAPATGGIMVNGEICHQCR
ncbi:MAG TPA: hypothetical protein VFW51_08660 [Actinomycetota bacterium]|nr:hypothetical protein [Actinomycetota bacterium]